MHHKFLLFSFVFAAFVLGAGYYFFVSDTGGNLSIEIEKPDAVATGVPFTVKVAVTNNSSASLDDARVALSLPENLVFSGSKSSKTVETKNLGRLGSGSVIQEEFELIATGDASSARKVTVTASYLPKGVSSRFEENKDFEINVSGSAIDLELTAPDKVQGGDDFTVTIKYKNISDTDLRDLQLNLDFPPGFEFVKSSLTPDLGNSAWTLGDLRKNSEMKFIVTGNLIGSEGAEYEMKAIIRGEFLGESYVIAEKSTKVKISSSPLSLSMTLNGLADYVASPNEELRYVINYANNTDSGLRDALIKVQLSGEMFDFGTMRSQGVVNPAGNSVVWNSATVPGLAVISPRGSGTVEFTIRTKSQYPISRLSDKNFTLKADVRMESSLNSDGSDKTAGAAVLESKVKGDANVSTKAFFRDASAGILNNGPFPPKVGAVTQYTIHWQIVNGSTDLTKAVVSAKLAPNVKYTGVSKSGSGNDIVYHSGTQTVEWNIEKILATRGVLDAPLEMIFQVEAVPSADQAGKYMPLVSETTFSAHDEFSGRDITKNVSALTTALPDDQTVGGQGGIVVQ